MSEKFLKVYELSLKEAFLKSLPPQHGAWSVLISGWAIGTFTFGNPDYKILLLFITMISGFCLRYSVTSAIKNWKTRLEFPDKYEFIIMFFYGSLTLAGFSILVFFHHLYYLFLFGIFVLILAAITMKLELDSKHLTVVGELVGMISLSTVIPVASYVAAEHLNHETGVIWILSLYLFAGSVFHVRYMVRKNKFHSSPIVQRLMAGKSSIIFHFLGFIVFLSAAICHIISPLNILPVSIVFFRAIWMILKKWEKPLPVRRLGFVELFITSLFSIMVITVNRS